MGIAATAAFGASLCIPAVRGEISARMGGHTVSGRLAQVDGRVRPLWERRIPGGCAGVESVVLVVLKDKREMRVYAGGEHEPVLAATYPIFAASGGPGPKLREGDRQVPEGVYAVRFLNPNSRFHLSMRVNYPNAADIDAAKQDGRDTSALGGDIMIHGGARSIGCVAIGNEAIEEVFWLVATVGQDRTRIVLSPGEQPRSFLKERSPEWLRNRYAGIEAELRALGIGGPG